MADSDFKDIPTGPAQSFDEQHPDWVLTSKLSQLHAMLTVTSVEVQG